MNWCASASRKSKSAFRPPRGQISTSCASSSTSSKFPPMSPRWSWPSCAKTWSAKRCVPSPAPDGWSCTSTTRWRPPGARSSSAWVCRRSSRWLSTMLPCSNGWRPPTRKPSGCCNTRRKPSVWLSWKCRWPSATLPSVPGMQARSARWSSTCPPPWRCRPPTCLPIRSNGWTGGWSGASTSSSRYTPTTTAVRAWPAQNRPSLQVPNGSRDVFLVMVSAAAMST